jgi:hypothetical protein
MHALLQLPAGAGVLRLQKLTLRLAQPSADQCMAGIPCMAPSLSIKSMGQVVSLPRIPQARSRRPSAMAMQMGLVPGPSPVPYPISQVYDESSVVAVQHRCRSQ